MDRFAVVWQFWIAVLLLSLCQQVYVSTPGWSSFESCAVFSFCRRFLPRKSFPNSENKLINSPVPNFSLPPHLYFSLSVYPHLFSTPLHPFLSVISLSVHLFFPPSSPPDPSSSISCSRAAHSSHSFSLSLLSFITSFSASDFSSALIPSLSPSWSGCCSFLLFCLVGASSVSRSSSLTGSSQLSRSSMAPSLFLAFIAFVFFFLSSCSSSLIIIMLVYGAGYFLLFCNTNFFICSFIPLGCTGNCNCFHFYTTGVNGCVDFFPPFSSWADSTVLLPVTVSEARSAWDTLAFCSPSDLELYTWPDFSPAGSPPCLAPELDASGPAPAPNSSTISAPSPTFSTCLKAPEARLHVRRHDPNLSWPIQLTYLECDLVNVKGWE